MKHFYISISSLLFVAVTAHANDLSTGFNFDGVLLDGSSVPIVVASSVTFQLFDPGVACLLYEETQSVTPDAQGNFSVKVGSQTGDPKRTVNDPALNWALIFQNDAQVRAAGTGCAAGYTPATGDNRYLRVIVNATTLSPDFAINSVPSATVAETLNGKLASDFVQSTAASTVSANVTFANGNSLRFRDSTTNYVGFTAPATVTNTVWTLPSADGTANQCLATNGSGLLSWFTPSFPASGGTISSGGLTVSGSANISASTTAANALTSTTSSTTGIAVNGLASAATGSTIGGQFQSNSTSGTALIAKAGNAATKGLVVEGAASQSANLTEWKVNGSIVSVMDARGRLGLGVTSPSGFLDVRGSGSNAGIYLMAGPSSTNGVPGSSITLAAGNQTVATGNGGVVTISGGDATGASQAGGSITLTGGTPGAGGTGGSINLTPGSGGEVNTSQSYTGGAGATTISSTLNYTGSGSLGGIGAAGWFKNTFSGSGGPSLLSAVSASLDSSGSPTGGIVTTAYFETAVNGGTHTRVSGVYGSAAMNSGTTTHASGGYFRIGNGTGLVNGYGVYISSVGGTNAWSLYAEDAFAPSYFAGNVGVGIGTASPSSALEVNGALTTRGMSAPAVSTAGKGRIYFDSTSDTYKVSQNGGAYYNLGVEASATVNSNPLSSITADFSNTKIIRANGASAACGVLNFTNVSSGGSYSVTIVNATTVCTTVQMNGSAASVKLPATYSAGAATAGIVYSAMYDGSILWVSYVPF